MKTEKFIEFRNSLNQKIHVAGSTKIEDFIKLGVHSIELTKMKKSPAPNIWINSWENTKLKPKTRTARTAAKSK